MTSGPDPDLFHDWCECPWCEPDIDDPDDERPIETIEIRGDIL